MAHIAKYKAHSVGHMLAHYRRDESSLDRDNIDRNRVGSDYTVGLVLDPTRGKYTLKKVDAKPNWDVVERRIEKVDAAAVAAGKRRTRSDAVVLADLVVTIPDNVPAEDEYKFFGYTYWFLSRRLGRENLMGGFVHRDEMRTKKVKDEETGEWVVIKTKEPVRDHMHVPFTPILNGRFNYKAMCPRTFYASLHKELGDYLEHAMGYRPHVELSDEERTERVYTDKAKDIDRVRKAVEDKTADARAELAEVEGELAQKAEERDGIQVQIDQCKANQAEEGAKLGALRAEVKEKQGLAADLSSQIEKKTAEKVEIQAQISDFSEKADAAEARLECVQGDLAAVESIEAAGLVELGKLAAGAGAGGRESAARSQNQALRSRLAALEEEGDGLAGRVRSLEEEKRGLEDENRGLGSRLAGLSRRLDDAWRDLVDAAERVKNYVFEQVEGLKWVFDALGLTAYEGMAPLADRGYDLDSECRDARAASAELGRSWEPPAPSFHHGR